MERSKRDDKWPHGKGLVRVPGLHLLEEQKIGDAIHSSRLGTHAALTLSRMAIWNVRTAAEKACKCLYIGVVVSGRRMGMALVMDDDDALCGEGSRMVPVREYSHPCTNRDNAGRRVELDEQLATFDTVLG